MEAKQDFIKQAYGEAWELVKDHVDENGWIESMKFSYYQNLNGMNDEPIINIFGGYDSEFIDTTYRIAGWRKENIKIWRPESLRGIEHNNGWIRCEDSFPEGGGARQVKIWDGKKESNFSIRADSVQPAFEKGEPISHWRYVDPVKPPIY